KTNLLEAIATAALTRSPRASSSAELLLWGADAAQVTARVRRPDGPTTLELRLQRSGGQDTLVRTLRVDGSPRPARAVLGVCPVVLFWPEDLRLVEALAPLAAAALREISDGREEVGLRYRAEGLEGPLPTTPEEAAARLVGALDGRHAEELARGVTVAGPHRDDVDILLDERPARAAASQGQQRSLVLACKLAEVRHLTAVLGMAPVLLLDDVLSELDARRREHPLAPPG